MIIVMSVRIGALLLLLAVAAHGLTVHSKSMDQSRDDLVVAAGKVAAATAALIEDVLKAPPPEETSWPSIDETTATSTTEETTPPPPALLEDLVKTDAGLCQPGTFVAGLDADALVALEGLLQDEDGCIECPTGTFSTGVQSPVCLACAEGQYTRSAGATACVDRLVQAA